MNTKNWCKSFLSIYNIIPSLIKSIDKLVYLKSINSSNFYSSCTEDTYSQVDKIAELTQRKVNLINLKVLADETLLELEDEKRKLLILRFIDNLECKKCIELSGMPRRSYFRALNKAVEDFEKILIRKIGHNAVIKKSLSKEDFFEEIFDKINIFEKKVELNERYTKEKYSNDLYNFIINRMKKVY